MAFDDHVVSTDPQEPPYAVRIEIRRRSPKSFEASNWIEIPMLFNHAGQVPVDLDRLYCVVASRLGVSS